MQISSLFTDTRGDASTIMMMFCPLEELENNNSLADQTFITGYKISISNDGRNFGEEEELFIFNSTFQYFEVIDGELKFFLKVFPIFNPPKIIHPCYQYIIFNMFSVKVRLFRKLCQGANVILIIMCMSDINLFRYLDYKYIVKSEKPILFSVWVLFHRWLCLW